MANTKYRICIFLFFFLGSFQVLGQSLCGSWESELTISFQTDTHGSEFHWILVNHSLDDTIANHSHTIYDNNSFYSSTFCILKEDCIQLTLFDDYGDGFNEYEGYIEVIIDNEVIYSLSNFGKVDDIYFNCEPGTYCENPSLINPGTSTQTSDEIWYLFTPDKNGRYVFSTCNNRDECNTTLWLYDMCTRELEEGFIVFNDKNESCGERAVFNTALDANKPYILRLKNDTTLCQTVELNIDYLGEVLGCTDPNSCNYNQVATSDDGSCFGWEDPRCHNGPDLAIDIDVLASTLRLDYIENDDECYINEECLKGYGTREIIRFTTRIENVGNLDYFVGNQITNPDQFELDECHYHNHILNYAQYIFYDDKGQEIPIGSKQGFCLLDSTCPSEEMETYNCLQQGISAGCYDEYDSALDCQWLDITDVPDGSYVLVAAVNPTFRRDANGRAEQDSINNRGQLCLNILRDRDGTTITLLEECEDFVDCAGVINGDAKYDCQGNCNGITKQGDLNSDQTLDESDIDLYLHQILSQDIYTDCSDLYQNKRLDIYDAYLLKSCLEYGIDHDHSEDIAAHSHCEFPTGVYNPNDSIAIELLASSKDTFIDVFITNTTAGVTGFQMQLEGIEIASIFEMDDSPDQLFDIRFDNTTGMITSLANGTAELARSSVQQHLLRIYYSEHAGEVCSIEENTVFVSSKEESIAHSYEEECAAILYSNVSDLEFNSNYKIIPNPVSEQLTLLNTTNQDIIRYSIQTINGKEVFSASHNQSNLVIDTQFFNPGLYILQVYSSDQSTALKFVKQ